MCGWAYDKAHTSSGGGGDGSTAGLLSKIGNDKMKRRFDVNQNMAVPSNEPIQTESGCEELGQPAPGETTVGQGSLQTQMQRGWLDSTTYSVTDTILINECFILISRAMSSARSCIFGAFFSALFVITCILLC